MKIFNNPAKKVLEALNTLKECNNLRKLYDYDLISLRETINRELEEREHKRAEMINSLEDICKDMLRSHRTNHTYWYIQMSPGELMEEANADDITDQGISYIVHNQMQDEDCRFIQYGHNTFFIKKVVVNDNEEKKEYFFEVQRIDRLDPL